MPYLYLIRGLPGSGKSTLAEKIVRDYGLAHFEADMFPGLYEAGELNRSLLAQAHAWCQEMTRNALAAGQSVVVSNTFTRLHEAEPYINMARQMGAGVVWIELYSSYGSIHNIPQAVMEAMAARWETIPDDAIWG